MNYYDQIMLEYYRVLNNAWNQKLKESARIAIKMLSDMPKSEKVSNEHLRKLMEIVSNQLGDEFSAEVMKETKTYTSRCLRLGLNDVQVQVPVNTSIGLYGIADNHLASQIQKQNLFWIGNHFDADIQKGFTESLTKAIQEGYTKEMLADLFKQQFGDIAQKSVYYWQGLAEHTALRIREFGRLEGYKKANARYYKLIIILDDRTSDICRALAAQDRVYPLNDALEVRDNLMALDTKSGSLDDAREYIKALAPWVKEDQIVYDKEENPIGVSGNHTPFPPFHWKCRTTTQIF